MLDALSLTNFFLMYFILSIPVFIYYVLKLVSVRKDNKILRCVRCGHSGRMPSLLINRELSIVTLFLLVTGVIPGLILLKWASRKYLCKICGTISRHLPSSETLADY